MARQGFLVGCAALIVWSVSALGYSQQYPPTTNWNAPATLPPSYYVPPTTNYYPLPPSYGAAGPEFDMRGTVPYVAQVPLEEQTLPPPLGSTDPAELLPEEALVATEPDSWVLPNMWFNPVDWDGGVEVGINGTEGNSQTFSMRSGANLKRKTEFHEISGDLTYLKTEASGIQTQHNAIANGKYERFFGDFPWSFFFKDMLEYDEFKAFDLRLVMNMGLGYQYVKTDTTSLKGRFGAGTSHEFGGPDDEWVPEFVYGADFEHQLSKRQKLSYTVDYYPEWDNFSNYRLVNVLSWEVILDAEHNLNLKLSINDRYDSTPNGLKPNDINYGLLLLWKL